MAISCIGHQDGLLKVSASNDVWEAHMALSFMAWNMCHNTRSKVGTFHEIFQGERALVAGLALLPGARL